MWLVTAAGACCKGAAPPWHADLTSHAAQAPANTHPVTPYANANDHDSSAASP